MGKHAAWLSSTPSCRLGVHGVNFAPSSKSWPGIGGPSHGIASATRRRCTARPGPTWANEPVVLVHGIGHNPSAWINLAERLDAAGFVDVHTVRYGLGADVPAIAALLDRTVSAVLRSSGESRVHVVAHSLGGVAARYWHDVLGGRHRADAVVTLGAPHGGTPWAHLGVMLRNARAIAPGSSMLVEHDHYPRWTTIGGSLDLVVPASHAHLRTSRRIDLVGVGHAGLLTSPVVADWSVRRCSKPSISAPLGFSRNV